jgi:hypothetical protein
VQDVRKGARAKLKLSPLEETALQQSSKSSAPVGLADLPHAKEIQRQELIEKLLGQ